MRAYSGGPKANERRRRGGLTGPRGQFSCDGLSLEF